MGRREVTMNDKYDALWDLVRSAKGNLPQSREAFDQKYREWENVIG